MQKLVISCLLVLFVVALTDAQRENIGRGNDRGLGLGNRQGNKRLPFPGQQDSDRRGNRRGGRRLPFPRFADVEKYSWDVDANAGTLIPQRAFVIPDKDVITLMTVSRDLREMNMTSSVILMNPGRMTMAIKSLGRRNPCFLTDLSATKVEIESDLAFWNDTTITLTNTVALNGTGTPLTREEVKAEYQADPSLMLFCRGGKLIRTTAMNAGEEDPDTKTVVLLGYDSQISIMVPESLSTRVPGRGRGRGRGRGPRRNGGLGENQDQGQGDGEGQTDTRRPRGRGQGGRGRADEGLNL